MTGFGRGEYISESYSFKTEVKTVNHRYNDISIRMPRYLNFLEERIKKEVRNYVKRGRVDVYINIDYLDETSLNIELDLVLARELNKKLNLLRENLSIDREIGIDNILSLGDIIKIERQISDEDILWTGLEKSLNKSLKDLLEMKSAEGENLRQDMEEKLGLIARLVDEIDRRSPVVVSEYREKLRARIEELLDEDMELDDERISQELAFFADKSNIDEEVTRLNSHIKQYFSIMKEEEPVGRKLDFLIQEMNREINTIGSKSGDIEITKNVVEVKSEIEKLREQVQNIE